MAWDDRLLQQGRRAWAVLGILGLVIAIGFVVSRLELLAAAFVLALFPAALMTPVADRMRRRGVPDALTALIGVVMLLLIFAVPAWLIVPRFLRRAPDLVASAADGLQEAEEAVQWSLLPGSPEGPGELLENATAGAGGAAPLDQGLAALTTVLNTATGAVLLVVILFFCLKEGRRLWLAALGLVPASSRGEVDMLAQRAWWNLGAYLRGQLLVALFDAVFIGLGLWVLGIPLALPLSVVVFFGALFPVVGSFVAGSLAVLVALAHDGLLTAGLVLALIVLVQQVEGNVLQPLVMSNIIGIHPLVVILSIVAGGILLGVLGAFIAVPLAAIVAMLGDHLRNRPRVADGPAADPS